MVEPQLFPALLLEVLNGAITARLEPSNRDKPLDANQLNQMLSARQMGGINLDKSAIDQLLNAARSNGAFSIEIGAQPEDILEIVMNKDGMTAQGEIHSTLNSSPLSIDTVKAKLCDLGIDPSLILEAAIVELLQHKQPTVIAQGRVAVNGTDTQFIPLFCIEGEAAPLIDADDKTLYFETKQYVTVEAGVPLMRRIPPSDPVDGINLLGKPIKAKPGKSLKFKRCSGAEVSSEDENLLVATLKGHPVIEAQGARVDQTLELKHVDLKSGNVHFDGSVLVKGDVLPQVTVIATGDIFIKGTVENANLIAGKNIVIGGGVISEASPDTHKPPKITTHLSANHDIHAKFLNLADIYAGASIFVQSYVMHSHLTAETSLVIGDKGGKGALIGGKTFAGHSITANTLGSSAYISTEVECGLLPEIRRNIASLMASIDKRRNESQQLKDILTKIKDDPAPKIGELTINRRTRITKTIDAIEDTLAHLCSELEIQEARMAEEENAFVQVNRNIFPRVTIKLHGVPYLEQMERSRARFTVRDGAINIQ